ncbi:MAG: hypothetical protein VX609_05270 [Verrucomicrobiota bacterium]|nr:hypothetical protein [Verrucomicrobiota bacterium]|tara:strand:+ start:116 stop:250 length:135 start_codon:yes stop_codon:yes gene_type:complete
MKGSPVTSCIGANADGHEEFGSTPREVRELKVPAPENGIIKNLN